MATTEKIRRDIEKVRETPTLIEVLDEIQLNFV